MEIKVSQLIQEASMPPVATVEPLDKRVLRWGWRFEEYHPSLRAVLPAVQRFCSDALNNRAPYWLTILGPSGVGKTFVLKQAYRYLRAGGDGWPIPIPYRKDGSERRSTCEHVIPARDLEDYRAAREYAHPDLVYVEDIGSGAGLEKGSGAVLKGRIAEMLQLRTGKWTMLDANMSRAEIADKIDPRIASRLKRDGSILIEIPADVPDFSDRPRS